jgi:hypothetical protein
MSRNHFLPPESALVHCVGFPAVTIAAIDLRPS